MILFDSVAVRGADGREYVLDFSVPTNSTSLLVLPSSVDKLKIVKYVLKLEEPPRGRVVLEFPGVELRPAVYLPEKVSEAVALGEAIRALRPQAYDQLSKILEGLGYRLRPRAEASELPEPARRLLMVLYALYSARGLSILVEPYYELDDKLLSVLSSEFSLLNSQNTTILAITSSSAYLRASVSLYSYAVVVEPSGSLVKGSRESLGSRKLFAGIEIFEVVGGGDVARSLASEAGFRGYLRLRASKYLLFVDSSYRWNFSRKLSELYRARAIASFKRVGREEVEG